MSDPPKATPSEAAGESGTNQHLSLRENAYDFINASLINYDDSSEDSRWLKFAIVGLSTAIELLLKARLASEHPLLVYANVDAPGRTTVSFHRAIDRLLTCGVSLETEDTKRLRRAHEIRNDIVHFAVDATESQLRAAFIDLFEFAHVFHERELLGELHANIDEALWGVEANLMEEFRRKEIVYQGEAMSTRLPIDIVIAQGVHELVFGGQRYARIPYGAENDLLGRSPTGHCHDCLVVEGQFHCEGCDAERCPRCAGQLLSCECVPKWPYDDDDAMDSE